MIFSLHKSVEVIFPLKTVAIVAFSKTSWYILEKIRRIPFTRSPGMVLYFERVKNFFCQLSMNQLTVEYALSEIHVKPQ